MHRWQCTVAWVLSLICLALSASTVLIARHNQKVERVLQNQRALIERGILGPQGQQVGNNVLQDLAATAQRNTEVRDLLARHGFQVTPAATNAAAPAAGTSAAPAATGDAP